MCILTVCSSDWDRVQLFKGKGHNSPLGSMSWSKPGTAGQNQNKEDPFKGPDISWDNNVYKQKALSVVPQRESTSVLFWMEESSTREDSREASLLFSLWGESMRRDSVQERESCREPRHFNNLEDQEHTNKYKCNSKWANCSYLSDTIWSLK